MEFLVVEFDHFLLSAAVFWPLCSSLVPSLAAMNHLMPALSENQAFLRAARRTIADRYRSLRAIEKDD